jgi:hypothetical protein
MGGADTVVTTPTHKLQVHVQYELLLLHLL